MRRLIIFATALLISSCTASTKYNENVRGIISYELDDSLYKLTKEHLVCYKCETNLYPGSVNQLINFEPETESCKSIFKKRKFDFIDPQINDFKITTKRWNARTIYVFTLEGLTFEQADKTKAPISQTMVVYDSEASCPA